jgi:hypothetical protein
MSTREQTTDAVAILLRRYIGEDPARKASLEQERILANRVFGSSHPQA